MIYYTCPDEYAATDWAGHYIEEHKEEIKAKARLRYRKRCGL